jgi:hypothetical protein
MEREAFFCARESRVNPAEDKGNGVLGLFEDPDGNEICLWEDSRKVGSFKSAVRSATTN